MHFIIIILSSEIMSTTGFIVSKLRTYQEAAFESDSWKSVTAFASHQSEVNIFCFMTVSWFTRLCFNNPIISKWVDSFSPFWCLISTVVKWPVSPMHWKQCTRNSDYLSTFEHPHISFSQGCFPLALFPGVLLVIMLLDMIVTSVALHVCCCQCVSSGMSFLEMHTQPTHIRTSYDAENQVSILDRLKWPLIESSKCTI